MHSHETAKIMEQGLGFLYHDVMIFKVLTLFPDVFQGPLESSMVGLATQRGLVSLQVTDIRSSAHDPHHTADDYQFGGGPGMALKPDLIFEAVDDLLSSHSDLVRSTIPIILTSPQGEILTQAIAQELSLVPEIMIICGHYAGVDERVRRHLVNREISIGDYVLTGGEIPAMVLIDSVTRLIPGVIGSHENIEAASITSGLLQHPLYTRPAEFSGMAVPEILLSGHHANIDRWRREQSLQRTLERRPDLLATADLNQADLKYLKSLGYQPPEIAE